MSDNFIKIAKPYKRTVSNVTYIVSAFGNAKSKHNADEMIMRMLENKISNGEVGLSNGNGKRAFADEAQLEEAQMRNREKERKARTHRLIQGARCWKKFCRVSQK